KAAVGAALPAARYAHFATHGFFAPEAAVSARSREAGARREVTGWNPLLLSGLALSGANRMPKDGEEDGILTALEVSEMDLTRLELAVLSACETGLGKVAGGEGVLGLQRAFAAAGCRSVVASLWSVDDAATAVLMERFYRHLWEGKKGKLEALRSAQLDVLRRPELVEGRGEALRKEWGASMRGAGLKAKKLPAGARRSPVAWWGAFALSGDWR
ncbi:MAG: CHAT domain-containing protein, partial [Gemmataceae bacterium]|nr:CHAT domain-containing protein [Gemmataceae bacterium]